MPMILDENPRLKAESVSGKVCSTLYGFPHGAFSPHVVFWYWSLIHSSPLKPSFFNNFKLHFSLLGLLNLYTNIFHLSSKKQTRSESVFCLRLSTCNACCVWSFWRFSFFKRYSVSNL